MRHENIYHTCDRCGIKLKKRRFFNDIFEFVRCYDLRYRDIIQQEEHRYKKDENGKDDVEIFVSDGIRQSTIELCPKCARAFRQFMRNK